MRTQSPDTSPEAERVLIDLLRAAPPWRRLQLASQMSQTARSLALSGLSLRHPRATAEELRRLTVDLVLGGELSNHPGLAEALLSNR